MFTFVYPMNEAAYTDAERQTIASDNVVDMRVFDTSAMPQPAQQAEHTEDTRPTILIVDDDTEIINYMRVLFSRDYRLITCLDADTALEEMRAAEPNLVLSDVAMPGKDGYELCQEIKQDIQLCHIPVILVTAKITRWCRCLRHETFRTRSPLGTHPVAAKEPGTSTQAPYQCHHH